MSAEREALHRIVVERDAEGDVASVCFVCDGGDDASCHWYPDCGCETWGGDHGDPWATEGERRDPKPGHENVQQPSCWIAPWFNDTPCSALEFAELYDGDEDYEAEHDLAWLVSGAVSTTWEGEYMTWEYAS